MGIKEFLHLVYGLTMGTSVKYFKGTRPLLPVVRHTINDQLYIFSGGSGNCGLYLENNKAQMINCGYGDMSFRLTEFCTDKNIENLFLNHADEDFSKDFIKIKSNNIYAPKDFKAENIAVKKVLVEQTLNFAQEQITMVPLQVSGLGSCLVFFLHQQSFLFLGPLFYNRVHPPLFRHPGIDIKDWVASLDSLISRFQPKYCVPHEGEIGGIKEVSDFIDYLKTFSSAETSFSDCRQKFDWQEIPGYTSLEENYDYFRP